MSESLCDINKRRQATRKILAQWGNTIRLCKRKHEEIIAFEDMIDDVCQISSVLPDGMPHGNTTSDPTHHAVVRIEGIIERYKAAISDIQSKIDSLMQLKLRVDELIDELPPEQRKVLELRYIDESSWTVIQFKMNRADSGVRGIERCAVDTLEQLAIDELSKYIIVP